MFEYKLVNAQDEAVLNELGAKGFKVVHIFPVLSKSKPGASALMERFHPPIRDAMWIYKGSAYRYDEQEGKVVQVGPEG